MKTFNISTWIRGGFLMILFLSNPGLSAQEITLPQTAVGKIAQRYFEAFNDDDPALMRDFTANYRTQSALDRIPLDSRMVQHNQIKGMIKTLSPRKVTASDDQSLTVLVYAEAIASWFETSFVINNDSPAKLENFGLKPATAPEEGEAEGFGEWTDLSSLLQNVITEHNIPGLSMAVIKDGRITETAVAGVLEAGNEAPVTENNRFHIGSITKSMTATLIGRLVENGQLKPESTLKHFFLK